MQQLAKGEFSSPHLQNQTKSAGSLRPKDQEGPGCKESQPRRRDSFSSFIAGELIGANNLW
jgi:hypothetical protein